MLWHKIQGAGGFSQYVAPSLSGITYDSVSFSVGSQEANPFGLFFKPDGTKFYVVGPTADRVFQYSMSVAWDLSTASYDSVNYNFTTNGATSSLAIKPDGTTFFLLDYGIDRVIQHSMSTPWDMSTASYDSKFLNVGSQENIPLGFFVKPDGTKMYILGNQNDTLFQYTLSTEWDVSTGSYDSVSYGFGSAPIAAPTGITFSLDGTKFYVADANGDIHQFSLSTAWDISSASYDSVSFDTASESASSREITFSGRGDKFYSISSLTDRIYQYST